jgi:putative oxidoreductase
MKDTLIRYGRWLGGTHHDAATSIGLLILRVGIGGLMAFAHGWGKLMSFGALRTTFPDPLGIGSQASVLLVVFAEFFCALALVFGAATRLASIPLIINMAVIVFIVHAADPWARQEFGLLFLIPFLALLFTGAGRYSIDALMSNKLLGRDGD